MHNSGRSLAARVLLDHYAQGRVIVESAGSEPGDQLNPSVVAILDERGLDPSREFPKPLTDETALGADVIVTMGCGDTCPVYPGKQYLDWELVDPAGMSVDEVRPIVEEIDHRVQALLAELLPTEETCHRVRIRSARRGCSAPALCGQSVATVCFTKMMAPLAHADVAGDCAIDGNPAARIGGDGSDGVILGRARCAAADRRRRDRGDGDGRGALLVALAGDRP